MNESQLKMTIDGLQQMIEFYERMERSYIISLKPMYEKYLQWEKEKKNDRNGKNKRETDGNE